jgi:hypothetical protein
MVKNTLSTAKGKFHRQNEFKPSTSEPGQRNVETITEEQNGKP